MDHTGTRNDEPKASGHAIPLHDFQKGKTVCYATRNHFSERELVDLTFAIIAINSWNRLAVSFRTVPGSYQPDHPTSTRKALVKQ